MLRIIGSDCSDPTVTGEGLSLALNVTDRLILDYLAPFDQPERDIKALEALRVGVIALRSVTPALDTAIVDQRFQNLERKLQAYAEEFGSGLERTMARYFESETGALPQQLDSVLGSDGLLPRTLEEYFHEQHGRLVQIVRDQVGPESDFSKVVDPDNSRGLLQRIENMVTKRLSEASDQVLGQFSLDEADSAIVRLQRLIADQVDEIKKENAQFFSELKEHFGVQRGRDEEALHGTQKGRDFEISVYERLAQISAALGDSSENLTATPGNIPRCKTGDYVVTLAEDTGAAGERIVFEAKNRAGYSLRGTLDELKQAKENRDAAVGIMIFETECCPVEVPGFRIIGNDILIRAAEEASTETDIYLDCGYRIARAMVVAAKRRRYTEELDVDRIAEAIQRIEETCERFSEIRKKAATIKQSAAGIEELADSLRPEIQQALLEIELCAQSKGDNNG
jgi:hypothetical protein